MRASRSSLAVLLGLAVLLSGCGLLAPPTTATSSGQNAAVSAAPSARPSSKP